MRKLFTFLLTAFLLQFCSSCAKEQQNVEEVISSFYRSGHQIKSNITINDNDTNILLEAYIDSSGNGEGLMSVDDIIYDVVFVHNNLYVLMLNKYYCISDLGYHLTLNRLKTEFTTIEEILDSGFILNDTQIIGFNGSKDGIIFKNTYAFSDKSFTIQAIPKEVELMLSEFIPLATSVTKKKADKSELIGEMIEESTTEATEEPPSQKKTLEPSFYTLSDLGIIINDNIFSINDFINPSDYFFNLAPEGISYKHEWDKDTKVKIQYTSYIYTTGKVTFVSTNNLIHKIEASCDFKFLDFYFGQSYDEVEHLLGNRLTKKQQETFKPIRDDLIFYKMNSKTATFTINDLTITLHFSNRILTAITINKEKEYELYAK